MHIVKITDPVKPTKYLLRDPHCGDLWIDDKARATRFSETSTNNGPEVPPPATSEVVTDFQMLSSTVGTWTTARHAVRASFLKPSPRKTMLVPLPAENRFAEIEWLPSTSPSGDRLYSIRVFSLVGV